MSDNLIMRVELTDVLCGRGGATNNHPGNVDYRRLVSQHQEQYLQAKKRDKRAIARTIVDIVRKRNGRFLKKLETETGGTRGWIDVGDQKAAEKTSQALREGLEVRRNEGTDGAAGGVKKSAEAGDADHSSGDEHARKKKRRKRASHQNEHEALAKGNVPAVYAQVPAVQAQNVQHLALNQWENQMRNMVSTGLPPVMAVNAPQQITQAGNESSTTQQEPASGSQLQPPRALSRTISADMVVPV